MPLVRAIVTAFLVLAAPAQASAQMLDPPRVLFPTEEIQARGIRVLAALLVVLTASGSQGGVAPDRVAEAERLLSNKLVEERSRRVPPMPTLELRRIADASRDGDENTARNAKDYNILHTFSGLPIIIRSPISHRLAAPCDSKRPIGWPRAEATEMLRDDCAGMAPRGERLNLSDGLHRRRIDSFSDVLLGQNAPPSPDRMNLDGISRTHLPALFIANW